MRTAQSYKHYIYACCCPGQVGRWNLISSSWYVKAGLLRFCGDHVRVFFFCKLHILHPGSRGPSSKYLRLNKPVDIKLKLFLLGTSRLVDAALPRTISIDKKKKSSGTQGTHFVKSRAHSPRPTSKIISIILLRDEPFWWRQTLWWAFMQVACQAVAHAHAKKDPYWVVINL